MCTNMSRYKPRFKREEEGLRQRSHDHEQEKEITKIHQMTELAGNFPGKSTFEKQPSKQDTCYTTSLTRAKVM